MRGINQRMVKVGGALIRSAVGSACSSNCMAVTAMRSRAGVTAVKNVRPASVRLSCDWLRLNKGVLNQASSTATCLLTAPWVTKSSFAALVKLT